MLDNKWINVEPGVQRKTFPPGISIMMMEVRFEKGAIGKKHKHMHEQLTYVLEGKFKFNLNDKYYIVEEGETIFIPSNVEHGVEAHVEGRLLDTFTPLREDLLE